MSFRHGLIIGKFYPPHAGHHAAIRRAADECDRVSVVVMASYAETVPLADRVAWLIAEHARNRTSRWPGSGATRRSISATRRCGRRSSHRCGQRVADGDGRSGRRGVLAARATAMSWPRRLGAKHCRVDRVAHGLSSTAVRADLAGLWPHLAPATRAGLATSASSWSVPSRPGRPRSRRPWPLRYRARGGGWADTRVGRGIRPRVHRDQVGPGDSGSPADGRQPPGWTRWSGRTADFDARGGRADPPREAAAAAGLTVAGV